MYPYYTSITILNEHRTNSIDGKCNYFNIIINNNISYPADYSMY